jgi:CheY-like chemotaxis protein
MAKILLVEDDNNLREIYEARLQAEGYTIVSARDGEEALVVAKAEKPDLVISDVMMPKISGFEMLDIMRNTDGLKDVKIIMLTALGQSDDQKRADKLGADRYLVKSQVTLEDIVKAAQDLLGESQSSTELPAGATSTANSEAPAHPTEAPAASSPVPTVEADAIKTAPGEPAPAVNNDTAHDKLMSDAVDTLVADTNKDNTSTAATAETVKEEPAPAPQKSAPEDDAPSKHKKVIKPLDNAPGKDINTLLAEEEAKEISDKPPTSNELAATEQQAVQEDGADASPAADEEAAVDAKIEDFVAGATTEPSTPQDQPAPNSSQPTGVPASNAPDAQKISVTTSDKTVESSADKKTAPSAPTNDPKNPDPNSIAL